MNSDRNAVIVISSIVTLIVAPSITFITGLEGWNSIVVGSIILATVFLVMYKMLSRFTPSKMSAKEATEINHQEMVSEIYKSIGVTLAACYGYDRAPTTTSQVKQILATASTILDDLNNEEGVGELKLIRLHEYMSDFSASFVYINRLETGDLIADDSNQQIREFITEIIPEMVSVLTNLKSSVDAGEVARGKVRRAALKIKTINDGMRRTTLDDIK